MELAVHQDKILNLTRRINQNERDRASDAGEDRAEIGQMLELTTVNKKAYSWMRGLAKMEQDKRDDVLRSFDALRPIFEKEWEGQSTTDMFAGQADEAAEPLHPGETIDDDWPEEGQPAPPRDPQIAEDEDDFEAALAQVDDRVVPFTGTAG